MKWVNLTLQPRTQEDFTLLAKLLEALGFASSPAEDYPQFRLRSFSPSASTLELVHRKTPRTYPDLELMISDPDSAVDAIRRLGLEILDDQSGPEPKHTVRSFVVRLPGGTTVSVLGVRTTPAGELANAGLQGNLSAKGKHFAVVISRFNSFITERLLAGTIDGLARCGGAGDLDIIRVPGSFEIPSAARAAAETGKYDAIICLGCLLRGDTAHYDVIVNEVTRGIGQSAQETGVPHAFGVLTCDTLEQAIDRAGLKMGNKGFEASLAAVEMANLHAAVKGGKDTRNQAKRVTLSAKPSNSNPNTRRAKKSRKPR
jgi:6,7-dimethyl-8-ribityllumazine synthase